MAGERVKAFRRGGRRDGKLLPLVVDGRFLCPYILCKLIKKTNLGVLTQLYCITRYGDEEKSRPLDSPGMSTTLRLVGYQDIAAVVGVTPAPRDPDAPGQWAVYREAVEAAHRRGPVLPV